MRRIGPLKNRLPARPSLTVQTLSVPPASVPHQTTIRASELLAQTIISNPGPFQILAGPQIIEQYFLETSHAIYLLVNMFVYFAFMPRTRFFRLIFLHGSRVDNDVCSCLRPQHSHRIDSINLVASFFNFFWCVTGNTLITNLHSLNANI